MNCQQGSVTDTSITGNWSAFGSCCWCLPWLESSACSSDLCTHIYCVGVFCILKWESNCFLTSGKELWEWGRISLENPSFFKFSWAQLKVLHLLQLSCSIITELQWLMGRDLGVSWSSFFSTRNHVEGEWGTCAKYPTVSKVITDGDNGHCDLPAIPKALVDFWFSLEWGGSSGVCFGLQIGRNWL